MSNPDTQPIRPIRPRRGSGAGRLVIYAVTTFVIAVVVVMIGYGAVGSIKSTGGEVSTLTAPLPPTPSSEPTPAVEAPRPVKKEVPIDPWCWSSRDTAESTDCQVNVVKKTKFVDRYRSHQSALAAKHTIVRDGPVGTREANSLARHGLLLCWMAKEPGVSLQMMVNSFTYALHPHQYTLPDPSKGAWSEAQRTYYAATQIHVDAIQAVCPSLADEYQEKGGPIIAELS